MIKKQKQEEQEEREKQGRPWKKMGIFNSFEEADSKRNKLLSDKSRTKKGEFQVKVKRCGFGGKRFMVKFRYLS
jgi:hypothetical protein